MSQHIIFDVFKNSIGLLIPQKNLSSLGEKCPLAVFQIRKSIRLCGGNHTLVCEVIFARLLIVHAYKQDNETIRIISARKAKKNEQAT